MKVELVIGSITVISTMITGDFITDLICGIVVYTASRLFYLYFGKKISTFIDSIKKLLK